MLGAGWIGVAYFVVTKVIGNLVLTTLLISFVIQAFRYISFVIQALFFGLFSLLPYRIPPPARSMTVLKRRRLKRQK